MKKILITTVVTLNPGDAAILVGTIRLFRHRYGQDVDIAIVDRQASVAQQLYPGLKFFSALFTGTNRRYFGRLIAGLGYEHRLKRVDFWRAIFGALLLKKGLRRLAQILVSCDELDTIGAYVDADLVLASGGTYIVPAYDMTVPLLDYEFSLSLGANFGTMPQSLGPLLYSNLAARYSEVFNSARFVCVRDVRSFNHLKDIGVQTDLVRVVPDAAFAIEYEGVLSHSSKVGTGPRIAISVRDWSHFESMTPEEGWEQYVNGLVALVEWLVDARGAHIVFISSCQGTPQYRTDDSVTASSIVAKMPSALQGNISVDSEFRSPIDLLDKLAEFDLIVATRMHVAILGLCSATPVLPIAYEFKTTELFAAMDLADIVVPIERMDGDSLIAITSRILKDYEYFSSHIAEHIETRRANLFSAIDELPI